MPPIQPCPIPYMGTNCTQTYQQVAGSAYTTYQGIFLSCALLLFLIITLQNIRLFRIRGCMRQHYTHTSSGSVPHQLFALSWFISGTLVIRATDPHGWAAHVPQWLEEFCLAMATSSAYNTLMIAVMNWIKIIHSISGRSPARVFRIQRILFIMMVVWHLLFSTLYSAAKPAFLYSTCSLAFNCTFNICVIAMGWFYGFRIYRHLSRYSSSGSSSSFSSASPSSSSGRPSVTQKNTSTDRARVRIIIHLLIAMTILSIVAVAVQLLTIHENIRTQYQTAHDAFNYPTFTLGNILLTYASFPIAQGVNVVIVLIFFRKLGSDSSSSRSNMDTEKSSRASSQKTKTRTRNSTSMTRADATAIVAAAAAGAGGVKGGTGQTQLQAQSFHKSQEKEKGQSTMPRHSNSSALLVTRQTSESIASAHALLPSHVHIPSSPSLIHHTPVIEPTPLHPHGIEDASHQALHVDGDVALDMNQHVNIEIQTI